MTRLHFTKPAFYTPPTITIKINLTKMMKKIYYYWLLLVIVFLSQANKYPFNNSYLYHIHWNLTPQLVSRKGLSRSLFSATKKWFGSSKVPEKSIAELKNTTGLLWVCRYYTFSCFYMKHSSDRLTFYVLRYPPEAPELQIRKMADLCFLVQHYELAYNCYHTAKKDFLSDQAMLYAAGSLVRDTHTHTHNRYVASSDVVIN